jgi:AraC-like DNA-binding protein
LARPAILYGLTGWLQEPERELEPLASLPENSEEKTPAAKKPSLTEEQGKAYRAMLESHFAENNPFCRPVYKVADLAKELKIPAYQLSAFINQEYGKNFNEFVNDHRVDYLYNLLKANPSYRQFTFEALSREAGFNSRNAFIASVKRKTGKTPSEYFDLKEAV